MLPSEYRPRVLLSIVTWNHEKSIRDTLDSIYQQGYPDFELVVFDNNSSDQTVGILQEYAGRPGFHLVANKENIGFCGGHNYVIRNFTYDILFLVNPDIILTGNYIGEAVRTFGENTNIGAVCGLLLQSSGQDPVIDSMGMQLTRSRRFVLRNHGQHLGSVNVESGYVAGLDGALPAFRRETVESLLINGEFFNQMFFSHKEDWDISWRLLLFNWKVYFNKDCVAIHPRGFKPNNLRERLRINKKVKYDAFKNQFLLLLVNEDRKNFLRDFFVIVPKIIITSLYCLVFERHSLRAYQYIFKERKKIFAIRELVQGRRKISPDQFRQSYINV